MSEPLNILAGPTCGQCKFWSKISNPANIAEKRGECREGPPHATAIPQPRGMMVSSHYPNLPADFPACGRYQAAVQVVH